MVRLAELGELKGGQGGVETIQEAHRALIAMRERSRARELHLVSALDLKCSPARTQCGTLWRYEAFKGFEVPRGRASGLSAGKMPSVTLPRSLRPLRYPMT